MPLTTHAKGGPKPQTGAKQLPLRPVEGSLRGAGTAGPAFPTSPTHRTVTTPTAHDPCPRCQRGRPHRYGDMGRSLRGGYELRCVSLGLGAYGQTLWCATVAPYQVVGMSLLKRTCRQAEPYAKRAGKSLQ